jgi:hypothetical protein
MSVTDPTEAYFKNGLWGWDLTQWRKLPLIFGYTDRYAENLGGTKSGAGIYTGSMTAVPAGNIIVANYLMARNTITAPTFITLHAYDGTNYYLFTRTATPGAANPVQWDGSFVLKEGDYLEVRVHGCLDADVIEAVVWGYKMAIAE